MALSIKTQEADELARKLAALTHESITDAVTRALRERLERIERSQRPDIVFAIDRLTADFRSQVRADIDPDQAIEYDEHGLPT